MDGGGIGGGGIAGLVIGLLAAGALGYVGYNYYRKRVAYRTGGRTLVRSSTSTGMSPMGLGGDRQDRSSTVTFSPLQSPMYEMGNMAGKSKNPVAP